MVRKVFSLVVALFMALGTMAIDINYTMDLKNGITLGEMYNSIKCDNDTLGDDFELRLFDPDLKGFVSYKGSEDFECTDIFNGRRFLAIVFPLDGDCFNFFNANCGDVNLTINGEKAEYFGRGQSLIVFVPFYIPPITKEYALIGLQTTCAKMTADKVVQGVKLPSEEELAEAGLKLDKIFLSDHQTYPQANPLNSSVVIKEAKTYSLVVSFAKVVEMNREKVTATIDGNPMTFLESGTNLFFIYQFTEESDPVFVRVTVSGLDEDCDGKTVGEVLNGVKIPSVTEFSSVGLELNQLIISDNEFYPQANPLNETTVLSDGTTYYFVVFFKKNTDEDLSNALISINGTDVEGKGNGYWHWYVYPFTPGMTSVSPAPSSENRVVYAEGGNIDCTGEVTKIYDANGLDVTASNGSLAVGLYIVECDGVKSKVIMQ